MLDSYSLLIQQQGQLFFLTITATALSRVDPYATPTQPPNDLNSTPGGLFLHHLISIEKPFLFLFYRWDVVRLCTAERKTTPFPNAYW